MNYIKVDENNVITAMSTGLISIPNGIIVDDIPANIEPMKWCYTAERGFYENPDYTPPEPEPEDPITQDDYNMDFDSGFPVWNWDYKLFFGGKKL